MRYSIDSPPDIGDELLLLAWEEVRDFHTLNGKPSIAYFQANRDALDKSVLLGIVEQVEKNYPECCAMLKLIRKYL